MQTGRMFFWSLASGFRNYGQIGAFSPKLALTLSVQNEHMLPPRSTTAFHRISQMAYGALCLSRKTGWGLISVLLVAAATGDLLTGNTIWFGPVYLFILCIATWLLGWGVGHGIGIFCMILVFVINGTALYPYASSLLSLDLALRFIAMSVVLSAIAAVRGAYIREWWLARIDPMTGALNRQAFFEFSDSICSSRGWRILLYGDLDGFKSINDKYGHDAGDRCLREFAGAIRSSIRKEDIFARMGGDEFVIFMAIKDSAAGTIVASRLHERMNNIFTDIEGGVRASLGALLVPPGKASIDHLVRQADALMYLAKSRKAGLQIGETECHPVSVATARAHRAPWSILQKEMPKSSVLYDRRASNRH